MRIGLFTDTYIPDVNGVANSTHILFEELRKQGHEVFVIAPRKGVGQCKWNEDHTVLRLAGMKLARLYGYVATTPIHLNALEEIGDLHLDVIHAQTEFGVGFFARMCAHQFSIPIVITYHTNYEDYTHYANIFNSPGFDHQAKRAVGYLIKLYANSSVEVIAPSQKTKDLLEQYHVSTNIFVVPTGLELDRFAPELENAARTAAIRRKAGVQEGERLLCYVGRIAEEKALNIVIQGFARAHEKGLAVRLMVVGDGPDRDKLEALAESLGVAQNVYFAGKQPSASIGDWYRAADGFVSASLSETQGMTFIEAMAAGLPLFARRDEVLADLLIEGKTGWYFQDADSLALALEAFMKTDDKKLAEMKQETLERVKPYSAQEFSRKALEVYQTAIDDYASMVKIKDVAIQDDMVDLTLEDLKNKKEYEHLLLTLDDYFAAGLRKGGRIDEISLSALRKRESMALAYQKCLKKLAVKDRTSYEMKQWLGKNTELAEDEIAEIVEHLDEKGYINDARYCQESITRMKLALFGKKRITRELKEKGISEEMVNQYLESRDDEEMQNALAYGRQVLASMPEGSLRKMKQQMYQRLSARGYSSDIINAVVAQLDFGHDETAELDALRTTAAKARRRYKKKYSGSKLRNTVFRYCAAQGFDSEDIYVILDEMEWKDR